MGNGGKKMVSILMVMAMLLTVLDIPVSAEMIDSTSERILPSSPVHHCTKGTDAWTVDNDVTDWSYVYFGSYPQSEVTGVALTEEITGASYDKNGDAWVHGTKFRRISKSDTNDDQYFGDSPYRYFKWERIKWKVLKINDSTLFVVADKGLDCKSYHDPGGNVTWESSALRSWLNDDFYQTAFSSNEQNAIVYQEVLNKNNPDYDTEGGNNTSDKIYLLSLDEAANLEYGFCENDGGSGSLSVKSSNYAHVRGAYLNADGICSWWLRSPGSSATGAATVSNSGYLDRYGYNADAIFGAVVPALHINLSSELWLQTDDGTSGVGGSVSAVPIVSGPVDQSVKSGTSVTFSVMVSEGNPSTYTYQWYYTASQIGTGTEINGATSSSYTIPANNVTVDLNGRCYYCVVSNGKYEATSDRAYLIVLQDESSSPDNNQGGGDTTQNKVTLKEQKIKASSVTKEYGSKPFFLSARTTGNGKLSYKSSNKKVAVVSSNGKVTVKNYGTATVTIRASKTTAYKAATKKITVKVVPKTASLTKATSPAYKKLSLNWKKDKTVTGYEVNLSLKKNFKSHTIKRNYKASQTSTTLVGVQSGKTYYVRVRSYKKVGKSNYYGSWSKTKKVKIK